MSKHLPECHRWFANMPEDGCPACEMFRACEQRVMTSDEPWQKASAAACGESFDEGYAAALNAAREAVAGLDKYHYGQISAADAIADIDALRRESDV